jgi:hypothetical protein
MGTAVRLTGFATVLAAVFGAAWGVGATVGPAVPGPVAVTRDAAGHPVPGQGGSGQGGSGHGAGHAHDHLGAPVSTGLKAIEAGYSLVPLTASLPPGETGEYAFTITGSDGAPVTAFDVEHKRQMHLVVVRRDTAGFVHIHPELGADAVWRAPLTLPAGGVYRVYADFVPTGGPPLTLGTDLFAPGEFVPVPLSANRVWEVGGYQVRLDGELVPGDPSQIFTTISKDGAPVSDLQPYLGAFGHLVALRRSDLSYLHVHPEGPVPAPGDRAGPAIAFTADVPSAGTYRLFLDFRHGDVVRTAEFTVPTRELP